MIGMEQILSPVLVNRGGLGLVDWHRDNRLWWEQLWGLTR